MSDNLSIKPSFEAIENARAELHEEEVGTCRITKYKFLDISRQHLKDCMSSNRPMTISRGEGVHGRTTQTNLAAMDEAIVQVVTYLPYALVILILINIETSRYTNLQALVDLR
ncbi:hypothetical protein BT96DRAFT_943948 [Gymnopus androsaceus JB14]|uniref:Uncharacterized protein n=1 Tax=Gymnopus androsaceus JB14 TaxID=1447944 RepID=A0A6A4H6H0_9AGAR|nr:hypothetical protein BT96DRAFT_943948 [Gymnopus androsaceus JB14]